MNSYLERSLSLVLLYLLVYFILLIIANPYKAYTNVGFLTQESTKIRKNSLFVLYALCLIFAFDSGDFYSYWNGFVLEAQFVNVEIDRYELVYNWFGDVVNGNYILWRSVIWGLAILFIYWTSLVLKLNNRGFLIAIALFGFGLDCYSRGILGHTMLLFGAVLFVDKRSNMLAKIIGLTLVCVSYYFHKSMYVNIIFAVLALFPFGKKTVVLSLIAFPFLTTIATYLINGIVSGELELALGEGVGGVGDRTKGYASQERMQSNLLGIIGKIVKLTPEYLTLFYLYYKVIVQKIFSKEKRERVYTYLFRLTYVAFYIASLFYFVETSSWIYERFKYMGFFPLVFILGAVWGKEKYVTKGTKLIINLTIFAIIWQKLYLLTNL